MRLKITVNPIEIATIYLVRAGNDWERREGSRDSKLYRSRTVPDFDELTN